MKNEKIWLSYSDKDKEKLKIFLNKLKENNIDYKSKKNINYGISILNDTYKLIDDINFFILCLSKNSIDDNYFNFELNIIMNKYFHDKNNKIRFMPLKLDDVNLNDIFYGLQNYKYCNFNDEDELNNMISLIIRELDINK